MATSVKIGDKVSCTAEYDVQGTHLASIVRTNASWVIGTSWRGNPNHIIISLNNKDAPAVVDISTLTNLSDPEPLPKEEAQDVPPAAENIDENALDSQGIEDAMMALLDAANGEDILKYSMKLFGIPHQYTNYCDYRTYTGLSEKERTAPNLVGRKFIENIMLEAPVISIIPGEPIYMPASNKKAMTYALMQAANGHVSALFAGLDEAKVREKMRYYDFKQKYFEYMEYVNIMCQVAASFLELGEYEIDGTGGKLAQYDWKNYRWNNDTYRHAAANVAKTFMDKFVDTLSSVGKAALNFLDNVGVIDYEKNTVTALTESSDMDDPDLIETLEDLTENIDYVQFYIDPSGGMSESATNRTTQSKLAGIFDAGSELLKEVAFIANTGGLDAKDLQETTASLPEALVDHVFSKSTGTIGGILQRLLESSSSVIKGEKMIFPEIYQASEYTKNYSITIDLRAPDGNRLSYYLNILVPLFHLMALVVPRQGTANTYSSPFIVRIYYPGVFSCNLGIVESISIERPGSDGWTVDNLPNEMKVTLNVKDLYSDMSITPRGDLALFLSNSSLIEYIATNCGINLITPQIRNRIELIVTAVKQKFDLESNLDNVSNSIFQSLDDWVSAIVHL